MSESDPQAVQLDKLRTESEKELVRSIAEVIEGKPLPVVMLALARLQMALLIQIPDKKLREKTHRDISAKILRAIKAMGNVVTPGLEPVVTQAILDGSQQPISKSKKK